jgi:hypothetical protein
MLLFSQKGALWIIEDPQPSRELEKIKLDIM